MEDPSQPSRRHRAPLFDLGSSLLSHSSLTMAAVLLAVFGFYDYALLCCLLLGLL